MKKSLHTELDSVPHTFLDDCFILTPLSSTSKKSPFLPPLRDALASYFTEKVIAMTRISACLRPYIGGFVS